MYGTLTRRHGRPDRPKVLQAMKRGSRKHLSIHVYLVQMFLFLFFIIFIFINSAPLDSRTVCHL